VRAGGPQRALAIKHAGGWIELRIVDTEVGAAQLTRELREAGIDGRVVLVPVPADMTGRWISVAEAGAAEHHELPNPHLGEIRVAPDVLRVPGNLARTAHDGSFAFYAGRLARDGEQPRPFPLPGEERQAPEEQVSR